MEQKKYTIRDIAKMSGVSHATVSRVINDASGVRPETRERILALIRKLNYNPNAQARNLSRNRSYLIGMLLPDIRNPFYAQVARGVEDKAHEKGYNVILCSTEKKPERMDALIPLMLNVGVDGFVFASARLKEPLVEDLIQKNFPVVLVSRKLKGENYNYVVFDNFKGAYDITTHLIDIGFSRIAIIVGQTNTSTGLDRLRGFQKALKDRSIPVNSDYIIQSTFDKSSGLEGAKRLLALEQPPEAIFAGSDYIAMGVIDAIGELGLRIPQDVALVGFDDTDFAACRNINLTTISQGEYEMGHIGSSILIDDIERERTFSNHRVVLEPRLIIRESCGYYLHRKQIDNFHPETHDPSPPREGEVR